MSVKKLMIVSLMLMLFSQVAFGQELTKEESERRVFDTGKGDKTASDCGCVPDDFRVNSYRIYREQRPENIFESIGRILSWKETQAALKIFGSVVGIPPDALTVLSAVPHVYKKSGEQWWGKIEIDKGYVFCNVSIAVHGVMPQRAHFNSTSNKNGIGFYGQLPKLGFGGGRSASDATLTLLAVKEESREKYYKCGICKEYDALYWLCKGRKCHGKKPMFEKSCAQYKK